MPDLSVFCSPGRYCQGENATAELGREMVNLGLTGPAFLVASRTAARLLDTAWWQSLAEAGIPCATHLFGGECSDAEIGRVGLAAQEYRARVVIGAGGGKALDTARAAADDLNLPVVLCPTLASTHAPCSVLSMIYSGRGTFERIRCHRRNPELVLMDTSVILQAPARYLAGGMGDALATYFEARSCAERERKSPSALVLARLCHDVLREHGASALDAVASRQTTPAFDRVVEANTLLSGLGVQSRGLGTAHAISIGLSVAPQTHNCLHGEKVAFGTIVQLILENRPLAELEEVLEFCDAIHLPTTLAQLGLHPPDDALLSEIAARASAPGESIHTHPFDVDPDTLLQAIEATDRVVRQWQAGQETSTPWECATA